MITPGDIISYLEMCAEEKVNLQRGMNYHLHPNLSVILMSLRPGAPYADRVEEDGRVLIYEGHDAPRNQANPYPKQIDQPSRNPGGSLTQNGLFFQAARDYKKGYSSLSALGKKQYHARKQREYRKRNPLKKKTRNIISNGVAQGKIKKRGGKEFHHTSYDGKRTGKWMAKKSHRKIKRPQR